jgi:hypothetical protein
MNDLTSLQPHDLTLMHVVCWEALSGTGRQVRHSLLEMELSLKGSQGLPRERGNANVAVSVSDTSNDRLNIIESDVWLGAIPREYYISF